VKLGVVADLHGNVTAPTPFSPTPPGSGRTWWALGDLVAVRPAPVEALESLLPLPGIEFVSATPTGT